MDEPVSKSVQSSTLGRIDQRELGMVSSSRRALIAGGSGFVGFLIAFFGIAIGALIGLTANESSLFSGSAPPDIDMSEFIWIAFVIAAFMSSGILLPIWSLGISWPARLAAIGLAQIGAFTLTWLRSPMYPGLPSESLGWWMELYIVVAISVGLISDLLTQHPRNSKRVLSSSLLAALAIIALVVAPGDLFVAFLIWVILPVLIAAIRRPVADLSSLH